MKALQELIIKTVDERYPYDTYFYNIVGFNVGRWNEFKKGNTDIGNMAYDRVEKMKKLLFTDFEMSLLDQAQFEKASNWTDLSVIDRYNELKIETVKTLEDNLVAEIGSTNYGNGTSNNKMYVYHEKYPHIKMIFKNIGAPAGKRNRREYILEHLDDLI